MEGNPNIRYSARTHVGLKRKLNEDAILALPEQKIWVVADGMGGHAAGDYASRLIIDTIATMPPDQDPAERMRTLRDAIQRAHGFILDEAARRGTGLIGATIVALMIANQHFVTFWAGDSRLYRLRSGEIEMLTTDHSVVADLVLSGQLSWDEAEHHQHSNAITRAVGVGDTLELDKIRGETVSGDRFLICSDGLTKYAPFATLQKVLRHNPIETVSDILLKIALDGGGADNISIIVIDVL